MHASAQLQMREGISLISLAFVWCAQETLHRIVMGMVGIGLLHAGYIQMQDSSMYNA